MHGQITAQHATHGDEPRRLLSVDAVAHALSLGRREVYRRLDEGDMESVWIGRRRLVPADSVDAFVARLRAEAAGRAGTHPPTPGVPDEPRPRPDPPTGPGRVTSPRAA